MSSADDASEPIPAAAALVSRYGAPLRRYFARRAGPASEPDDLVQEVFLRMLRRSAKGSVENVQAYLFQTASNLVGEQRRRETVRRAAASVDVPPALLGADEEPSPERILMGRENCRRLDEALRELPERTRTVLLLNRLDGLTGVEIARSLGVSVGTVEKDMTRAIAHLRERLA